MVERTPAWAEIVKLARARFGIRVFRPGQRELIEAVLAGRDAIGVMPTGAGKSLTFQLPALVVSKPVLVVSPLIALMQDQHDKLLARGVSAAKLNSSLSAGEQAQVAADIEREAFDLIYTSPERLEKPEELERLKQSGVSLMVVDEAHCVSQWGHDFRPAYLALRDAWRELGRPPVLALTATASPAVLEDIKRQLDLRDPYVVNTGIDRPNLFYEVLRTPSEDAKRMRLLTLLREGPKPSIIYSATVRLAQELQCWLAQHDCAVGVYHGKLGSREREDVQRRFMQDELDVMVATNAFGLGLDKPNIRGIVHYHFPDSLETYYQEVGRAGRDGQPARVTLLYRLEDKRVQTYFLGGKYPRREETLKVLELLQADGGRSWLPLPQLAELLSIPKRHAMVIAAQLTDAGLAERKRGRLRLLRELSGAEELAALLEAYEARRSQDRERLNAIMHFAQSAKCRNRVLHEYFEEPLEKDCGHCDNCEAHAAGQAAAGLAV
jgi:ATP-dependent DNA helicase RecQ